MTIQYNKIIVLFLLMMSLGCSNSSKKSQEDVLKGSQEHSSGWKQTMQSYATILSSLYPLVLDDQAYVKKENQKLILEQTRTLKNISANLPNLFKEKGIKYPNQDYLVKFVPQILNQNFSLAEQALRSGKLQFARGLIKNSLNYCTNCHSTRGGKKMALDIDLSKPMSTLNEIEKADLLMAQRNYKEASKLLIKATKDKTLLRNNAIVWDHIVQNFFTISIKINNSPDESITFAKSITKNKLAPLFIVNDAKIWLKDLYKWKKTQVSFKGKDQLKMAQILLKQANKRMVSWGDRPSLVLILRATAMLHNYLQQEKRTHTQLAQASLTLGVLYKKLDLNGSFNSQQYLKFCVFTKPHSLIAVNCYKEYEESVRLGFSGSSGFHAPPDVLTDLNRLKKQAQPL